MRNYQTWSFIWAPLVQKADRCCSAGVRDFSTKRQSHTAHSTDRNTHQPPTTR